MTRISRRYIPPLLVVLFPVLIPVLVHSYARVSVNDCADPSALFSRSPDKKPDEERERWMREIFEAADWEEGELPFSDSGARFDFAIIRSYDPKKLYHHPDNRLVRGATADRRGLEWLATGSEQIPIHRAYYDSGASATMVAYLLVLNSEPVANPYLAQIASFPKQLFTGSRPMTIFFISASGDRTNFPAMERRGREWLATAWERYRAACCKTK